MLFGDVQGSLQGRVRGPVQGPSRGRVARPRPYSDPVSYASPRGPSRNGISTSSTLRSSIVRIVPMSPLSAGSRNLSARSGRSFAIRPRPPVPDKAKADLADEDGGPHRHGLVDPRMELEQHQQVQPPIHLAAEPPAPEHAPPPTGDSSTNSAGTRSSVQPSGRSAGSPPMKPVRRSRTVLGWPRSSLHEQS